jgi:synaptotagmin-15
MTGLLIKDFGSINPALYQSMDGDDTTLFPEDHNGRLWFTLAYERESEKLIVTLVKAKNLPCRADKSPCDPFVRWVH